jgi:hypothetical protein
LEFYVGNVYSWILYDPDYCISRFPRMGKNLPKKRKEKKRICSVPKRQTESRVADFLLYPRFLARYRPKQRWRQRLPRWTDSSAGTLAAGPIPRPRGPCGPLEVRPATPRRRRGPSPSPPPQVLTNSSALRIVFRSGISLRRIILEGEFYWIDGEIANFLLIWGFTGSGWSLEEM